MTSDQSLEKILNHLRKDPIIRVLVDRFSIPKLYRGNNDTFLDLIETIINQQLSSRVGDIILERFKNIFKNQKVTPKKVFETPDKVFRQIGISFQKINYIKGLCSKIIGKELDLELLKTLSDAEITEKLVSVKGIGKWSVDMMLIFSFKRKDVFSVGDLGLCTAVSNLYKIKRTDKKKIENISFKWVPYRSYACWYLWRSLVNE